MNKKMFNFVSLLVLLVISLLLYGNAAFSKKPLGLDALGHLSKIAYLKEFGLGVRWDMSWYCGAPFLAYYSPLYYKMAYLFEDIVFGSNFLVFLSIFLTSVGIFSLVYYYSKNQIFSLIFSLFFLSVLCISYYFIVVANLPYVFSMFTIPFAILFLEKTLENKRSNFLLYNFFFVLAFLTHIFSALVIFLIVVLRISIFCYLNKREKFLKNVIKENLIYVGIPFLISSFWFVPFLLKSKSFIGDEIGYIPIPTHLLGFGDYIIWGKAPGEIGLLFAIFIFSLSFIGKYFKEKDEKIIFLSLSSILLFLLMEGILAKYYPTGIGAIRFILPFSIVICAFSGAILAKKFEDKKEIIYPLVIFLIIALILNYNTINTNYKKYSYNKESDRYGIIDAVYSSKGFPLTKNFSNYRFGTSRFIFSETLNYKFPGQSQTWGYFDQGILYPKNLYEFKETVWFSQELNKTIENFEKYGIKYFEIGGQDLKFDNKFKNNNKFFLVKEEIFADYPFKIYEYKEAKPIIGIILKNNSYEDYSEYQITRNTPDEILIKYNFSGEEKIVFKESFHKSWKAKEKATNHNIEIKKTEDNFMILQPPKNSDRIIIYQSKTHAQKIGIALSLIGIVLALFIALRKHAQSKTIL